MHTVVLRVVGCVLTVVVCIVGCVHTVVLIVVGCVHTVVLRVVGDIIDNHFVVIKCLIVSFLLMTVFFVHVLACVTNKYFENM